MSSRFFSVLPYLMEQGEGIKGNLMKKTRARINNIRETVMRCDHVFPIHPLCLFSFHAEF